MRLRARRTRDGGVRIQKRRMFWAGAAVAAVVALAGCSSGTASSTSSSTTSNGATSTSTSSSSTSSTASTGTTAPSTALTTSTCQPDQLQITPGMGNGAAGTIEVDVTMTNTSNAACTMNGYPGMQLLDASGNAIVTNVVRGGGRGFPAAATQPPSLVTLAPGQQASFSLSYEDVPIGNETSCPTSAKARVTPPNDMAFAVIAFQAMPCGGGTINVSPVYAG